MEHEEEGAWSCLYSFRVLGFCFWRLYPGITNLGSKERRAAVPIMFGVQCTGGKRRERAMQGRFPVGNKVSAFTR